jgi:magnesium transporter
MVVQFGFLKAIVTAEELFLLDPSRQEVLPFVEKLKKQFPCDDEIELSVTAAAEGYTPSFLFRLSFKC